MWFKKNVRPGHVIMYGLISQNFYFKKFKDILILLNQRNHFGFVTSVLKTMTK